jgi:RecG-like helicase
MGIRSFAKRLTTSDADLDTKALQEFCADHGVCSRIADLEAREEASVIGEIASLRIVPHNGSPWLEATITDGTGHIMVMWTGRREIAGVTPGKRLVVSGRFAPTRIGSKTLKLMNPAYELIAKPA